MVAKKHGKVSQQWNVIYVDEYPEEPKKGELNPDFGLYVERDFHIVSQMSANRYLDLIGNNFVIKSPNSRKSQIWYFDQRSYTIKSRIANKSWDIISSGKSTKMQIYTTNSGWF